MEKGPIPKSHRSDKVQEQRATGKTEHGAQKVMSSSRYSINVYPQVAVSLFGLLRPQIEAEAVSHRPVFRERRRRRCDLTKATR